LVGLEPVCLAAGWLVARCVPFVCLLLAEGIMLRRVAVQHGKWPEVILSAEDTENAPGTDWQWDFSPIWGGLHNLESRVLHRVCQKVKQTWPRWCECLAVLYPGEAFVPMIPPEPRELDCVTRPKATTHTLFAIFYWAVSNYKAHKGSKGRSWGNRLAAAQCLHSFVRGHVERIVQPYSLFVYCSNKTWQKIVVTHGRADMSAVALLGGSEWEKFVGAWNYVLAHPFENGLKLIETSVTFPSIADLIYGLLLLCRPLVDIQMAGFAVSILEQLSNLVNNNICELFVQTESHLRQQPGYHNHYDRRQLGRWFETFQSTSSSSGYDSLVNILRFAGVGHAHVYSLCSRLWKQASQRLLIRIRHEFQHCFKFTLALDKSKAIGWHTNTSLNQLKLES